MVRPIQVWDGDGVPRAMPKKTPSENPFAAAKGQLGSFPATWTFEWLVSPEVVQEIVVGLKVLLNGHPLMTVGVTEAMERNARIHRKGMAVEVEQAVMDHVTPLLVGTTLEYQSRFGDALRTFIREQPP